MSRITFAKMAVMLSAVVAIVSVTYSVAIGCHKSESNKDAAACTSEKSETASAPEPAARPQAFGEGVAASEDNTSPREAIKASLRAGLTVGKAVVRTAYTVVASLARTVYQVVTTSASAIT